MKQIIHLGIYGILIKENQILLVQKVGGPYHGKLDLPGGTSEFGETPEQTLFREIKEETGSSVIQAQLFHVASIQTEWIHKGELEKVHHMGIFYQIEIEQAELKKLIPIDSKNDDSKGADFYPIAFLKKHEVAPLVALELEQLGYQLSN